MSSFHVEAARLPSDESERTLGRLERASAETGGAELAARLAELQLWLGADLAELERELSRIERELEQPRLDGSLDRALLAARHLVALPGKRVRPICVLLAARLGGVGPSPAVHRLALASELVHTATLLHDDVIDEGTERRGVTTARRVFGNSASVLAGDHLLVRALKLVASTELPGLLPKMLSVIDAMITAESMQLASRISPILGAEAILTIIRGKTGALFAWSMEAGGVAAGFGPLELARLSQIGMSGGIAFQLADDVLDLAGDAEDLGKSTFSDLREGKVTWPVRIALERDPALMAQVRSAALEESPGVACSRLAEGVRATGALQATSHAASEYLDKAVQGLAQFEDSPARRAIELVLSTFVKRRA
ncbi:MAG: polyprenyl synthetase family protein [Deltaproteobacteria bacterium]|nr:polyprenyl synthetase family protein [Deltaproteobacteria bacterium]